MRVITTTVFAVLAIGYAVTGVVHWRNVYAANHILPIAYRWDPAEPPWFTALVAGWMRCPHPDGFVTHPDDFVRGIGRCPSCGLIRPGHYGGDGYGGATWAIITPTPIGYTAGVPVTPDAFVGWAIMHTATDRVPDRFYAW